MAFNKKSGQAGMTRKFGKKRLYLVGSAKPNSKIDSTKEAERLRRKGLFARVVKVKDGYRVYAK